MGRHYRWGGFRVFFAGYEDYRCLSGFLYIILAFLSSLSPSVLFFFSSLHIVFNSQSHHSMLHLPRAFPITVVYT